MRPLAPTLLLMPIALALQINHHPRQAPQTQTQTQTQPTSPPSPFSANAAQLISLYIPASITPILYSVYTAHDSTTGDPAAVIEAAFTAATPPAWLDAVPTEYRPNVEALRGAVEGLRAAATATATATGATSGPESASSSVESSLRLSLGSSLGSNLGGGTTSEVQETGTGSVQVTGGQATGAEAGATGSEGMAAQTNAPVAAVGIVGFVGALLAL